MQQSDLKEEQELSENSQGKDEDLDTANESETEVIDNESETEALDSDIEVETVNDESLEDNDVVSDSETDKDSDNKESKAKFFKKKEKKDKKDALIEELQDKYKRAYAEFDNFRKRTDKEKSMMYTMGVKDIVEKLLPVVDNFERGFAGMSDEELAAPFASGMDKVYKQLLKMLEDTGVTSIEAVGNEFDPNFHNAVMHVEDESLGENVIAEEFQKGYMYKDTVVRHSMVKVAN